MDCKIISVQNSKLKKFFLLFISCLTVFIGSAQFVHKLKGDTILITNDSSAELVLENSTRATKGFLYNKENGRTEFRKALTKISDSTYLIGNDTLKIGKIDSTSFIRN